MRSGLGPAGYMLLAGRCRNPGECDLIQQVIEKRFKRKIDLGALFGEPGSRQLSALSGELLSQLTAAAPAGFSHCVDTEHAPPGRAGGPRLAVWRAGVVGRRDWVRTSPAVLILVFFQFLFCKLCERTSD